MVGGLAPPPLEEEEQATTASSQAVYFVLESAQLEVAQLGKTYQLLSGEEHQNFLKKHNKDPALYRPDICHQALLTILDSPLNKAGKVKGLYIHTNKNVLLYVNPKVRLPRTYKRFAGLMVQLLQKLSIRATNGSEKLMKAVKGPVTKYFPLSCRRIGMSFSSKDLKPIHEYVKGFDDAVPVVFCVGAFAHGKVEVTWTDEDIAISQYPLSAAVCLGRITNAFEQKWKIL